MDQTIDRNRIRDPREVSGWGACEGKQSPQDYSDIARRAELNVEFERGEDRMTSKGRADGSPSKSQ